MICRIATLTILYHITNDMYIIHLKNYSICVGNVFHYFTHMPRFPCTQNNLIRKVSNQPQLYSFWRMALINESLENIGHWSTRDGLLLNKENLWEIKSFEGKHFRVATLPVGAITDWCTILITYSSVLLICMYYSCVILLYV